MSLRFDNRRIVAARELPEQLRRTIGADDEARIEVVDVVAGDEVRYRAYFFEGGSAAVVDREGERVLSATQHNVEPGADESLLDAVGAAYALASPRIEQVIRFRRPEGDRHARLGTLTYDGDAECWYADAEGVRLWISGDTRPDLAQLVQAEAILDRIEDCRSAVQLCAPGATISELELWKPGALIVHTCGAEPSRLELPWPLPG